MKLLLWSVVVVALLSVILSGATLAADYWPMIEGSVYRYVNDAGSELTLTVVGSDLHFEYPDWYGYRFGGADELSTGPNGEAMLEFCSGMGENWIDPDMYRFNPAVPFLEFPLTVGNTWFTTTNVNGLAETFVYSALRVEYVTVPAGIFEVLVVNESSTWDWPSWSYRGGDWYLDREIGPVILPNGYRLIEYDVGAVPTESRSWGSVKSNFRQ